MTVVSQPHSKERQVYLLRAEQARSEADAATLDNVRDRCLRAEAAWMQMAARAERSENMRALEAAAKAETEPKYADTRDGAAAEVARLENKVGKVVLTFADGIKPGRTTLNGNEVAAARFGRMASLTTKCDILMPTSPLAGGGDATTRPRLRGAAVTACGRRWSTGRPGGPGCVPCGA